MFLKYLAESVWRKCALALRALRGFKSLRLLISVVLPISLLTEAEEYLRWVVEKPDGSLEFLSRTEFENRNKIEKPIEPPPEDFKVVDPHSDISGLVYYWPMDDGQGTVVSGLGVKKSPFSGSSGGPEWDTDSAPTTFHNPAALRFDGIDDSVDLGRFGETDARRSGLFRNTSTIALWFKSDEPVAEMSLLGFSNQTTSDELSLRLNPVMNSSLGGGYTPLFFILYDRGNTRRYPRGFPGNTSLCDGAWHHYALSFNNEQAPNVWMYVDGAPIEIRMYNGGATGWPHDFSPLETSLELGIHKSFDQSGKVNRRFPFKGLIDDVRIYHRVLSEAEIHQLASRRK